MWYGGQSDKSVNVHRLVGYVDQYDNHFPLMTVRETFKFSLDSMTDYNALQTDAQRELLSQKSENVIQLLGLKNAADTIIGDDLIRGVSGGERKRVTIGEMLMGTYRAVLFGACALCVCVCAALVCLYIREYVCLRFSMSFGRLFGFFHSRAAT